MKKLLLLFVCLLASACAQPRDHLTGGFFQFTGMDQSIPTYLDEMRSLGMDTVVTVALRFRETCSSPYTWAETGNAAMLGTLLQSASERGMHVYVGLLDSEPCNTWSSDPVLTQDMVDQESTLEYVLTNFGQNPALAGWYIANEPYIEDDRWLDSEIPYYRAAVQMIRRHSALPVLTSPYLVALWPGNPAVAADVAGRFLDATGLSVLIYQDGQGGSSPPNLGWSTSPTMGDYFAAISARVGPQRLWVLHELFNSVFGIDAGVGSESITRLNQQISRVPAGLISGRLSWTSQTYMSAVVPGRGPEAERLLAGYRATHGFGGEYIRPGEVLWLAQPFPLQSYISSTLLDGVVGDPFTPSAPQWVGTPGFAAFILDLWAVYDVDWVSVHVAKQAAAGIEIPQDIVLWGSVDGQTWDYLAMQSFTSVKGFDGERDIGNTSPLNAKVRFLWVYLVNSNQTRLDEVEVVGK